LPFAEPSKSKLLIEIDFRLACIGFASQLPQKLRISLCIARRQVLLPSLQSSSLLYRIMGPAKAGHHRRHSSFALVDETVASSLLNDVLRDNNIFVGGSSLGKGLKKAAHYYFNERLIHSAPYLELPGRHDLAPVADTELMPLEDSFYVVDIAMVVSQVRT
jgi:hypothetical protein